MQTMAGDDVAGIKRRRHDLSGDGVWILAMVSQRSRLKVDLEPSMWQRRQKHKATPSRRYLTREALEDQLLSVSLLTHLWKRECAERIP
ncbi:hypothetical protein Tco_1569976 [Tanacetum coccineum]